MIATVSSTLQHSPPSWTLTFKGSIWNLENTALLIKPRFKDLCCYGLKTSDIGSQRLNTDLFFPLCIPVLIIWVFVKAMDALGWIRVRSNTRNVKKKRTLRYFKTNIFLPFPSFLPIPSFITSPSLLCAKISPSKEEVVRRAAPCPTA